METMPFVCMYKDYLQTLEPFTDEERGRLFMALLRYLNLGEEPEFTGNERYIWPTLAAQLQRDQEAYRERCERNRRNGTKGGRPKKEEPICLEEAAGLSEYGEITDGFCEEDEITGGFYEGEEKTQGFSEGEEITQGFSEKPKKPNKKDNKNDNEKENENDNEKENEKENESESPKPADTPPTRARFVPPKEEEVREYCVKMGFRSDPSGFMDYYRSNGWRVGKNPMKDWKAALRNWMAKEGEYGKTRVSQPLPKWTVGVQL